MSRTTAGPASKTKSIGQVERGPIDERHSLVVPLDLWQHMIGIVDDAVDGGRWEALRNEVMERTEMVPRSVESIALAVVGQSMATVKGEALDDLCEWLGLIESWANTGQLDHSAVRTAATNARAELRKLGHGCRSLAHTKKQKETTT